MLQNKSSLEKYIEKLCLKIVRNKDKFNQVCNLCEEEYNMPRSKAFDLLSGNVAMSGENDFVLFILLDCIEKACEYSSVIDSYFTETEISTYKSYKFEIKKTRFPLEFKMVQINSDQWIGKITVDELMDLKKASLINYKVETQRTMQRIVKGDNVYYKIMINKHAVDTMKESFEEERFISNTITLNIPYDEDANFYYDDETSTLVIKSLGLSGMFDITDGYHRYLALCQTRMSNPDFNYTMELRITNFDEDKAKRFIFQEDQKTKMKKVDSNSYDMNNAANIAVTKLNENVRCNFNGMIKRNGGNIPFAEFAILVGHFYFKNSTKDKERSLILNCVKDLTEKLNTLTEAYPEYLEKVFSYKELAVMLYIFNKYEEEPSKMIVLTSLALNHVDIMDSKKFYNKTPRKVQFDEIEKLIQEVWSDV